MEEVLILDAEIKKLFEREGGGWSFHDESSQPKSVTSLQRLCKVFGTRKSSLSYNRMELPLWPHKQREAL